MATNIIVKSLSCIHVYHLHLINFNISLFSASSGLLMKTLSIALSHIHWCSHTPRSVMLSYVESVQKTSEAGLSLEGFGRSVPLNGHNKISIMVIDTISMFIWLCCSGVSVSGSCFKLPIRSSWKSVPRLRATNKTVWSDRLHYDAPTVSNPCRVAFICLKKACRGRHHHHSVEVLINSLSFSSELYILQFFFEIIIQGISFPSLLSHQLI